MPSNTGGTAVFKKTDINKQLKIFVVTLFMLFFIIFINILLTYSNISDYFISSNGNTAEKNSLSIPVFKYLSIITFIASILLSIFLMFVIKEIYRKIILSKEEMNYDTENSKAKSSLILNMYHELKTPISVILGAIKLMESKDLEDFQGRQSVYKHMKIIKSNSYRLLRLLNNILDISRINSGNMSINPRNCNIAYLAEEITQSVSSYAEAKNLKLEFFTDTEEIITAVDEDKFERILLNLLSNAIKFSGQNGRVAVYVKAHKDRVLISVSDTGPGIPPSMHQAIFERFRQVNSSLTRHGEGSGLGLSIVKSYVELHGGKIYLKSEEGKGSEFTVELPVRLVPDDNGSRTSKSNDSCRITDSVNVEFSDIR
jgi:signal transduction histidine kinase